MTKPQFQVVKDHLLDGCSTCGTGDAWLDAEGIWIDCDCGAVTGYVTDSVSDSDPIFDLVEVGLWVPETDDYVMEEAR